MDGEEVQKLICSDRVGVELCRSQSIFELLVLQFGLSGCTVSVCHINYIPSRMYPPG